MKISFTLMTSFMLEVAQYPPTWTKQHANILIFSRPLHLVALYWIVSYLGFCQYGAADSFCSDWGKGAAYPILQVAWLRRWNEVVILSTSISFIAITAEVINVFQVKSWPSTWPGRNSRTPGSGEKDRNERVKILKKETMLNVWAVKIKSRHNHTRSSKNLKVTELSQIHFLQTQLFNIMHATSMFINSCIPMEKRKWVVD